MKHKPLLFSVAGVLFLGVVIGWFYGSLKGISVGSFTKSEENPVNVASTSSVVVSSNAFDSKSKNDISKSSGSTYSPVSPSNLATIGSASTSELGGTPAQATIKVGSKSYDLKPDIMGGFPRIVVPANGKIQISVAYPEGIPQDPVVIQAQDGGWINDSIPVKQGVLDENKVVSFAFTTAQEEGIYRVTLRKGTDEKHLHFWVGEEPRLQVKSKNG